MRLVTFFNGIFVCGAIGRALMIFDAFRPGTAARIAFSFGFEYPLGSAAFTGRPKGSTPYSFAIRCQFFSVAAANLAYEYTKFSICVDLVLVPWYSSTALCILEYKKSRRNPLRRACDAFQQVCDARSKLKLNTTKLVTMPPTMISSSSAPL